MSTTVTRREFMKRSGTVAGLAAFTGISAAMLHTPERHPFAVDETPSVIRDLRVQGIDPGLVVVRGDDPAAMLRHALKEAGGMEAFVSKGDRVVVKPNIGWDRKPEQAANTNPDLVAETVRQCFAAGAAEVIVTDVTCNDANRCFNKSGIAYAAREAGAAIQLPRENRFRDVNMGGAMLGTQKVDEAYLQADKFINIPIAKHHGLTRVTLSMKNLYGILGGNRSRLHQDIHNSIADLARFLRPTLVIMDAYRVLLHGGPQGGSLQDVDDARTIALGTDPVAVDAWSGAEFFGLAPGDMPWLALAEAYGVGTSDLDMVDIRELGI
jgi:uncharacterized protein (DUF362 family)